MAATFLQALVERYGTVGGPELWREVQPEGTAQAFANAVLIDLGQRPEYQQGQSDGTLTIAYVLARAKFVVYDGSLAAAEALALAIQAAMEDTPHAVGTDGDVRLFREDYRANRVSRGPQAQFVFAAQTTYRAMFRPL